MQVLRVSTIITFPTNRNSKAMLNLSWFSFTEAIELIYAATTPVVVQSQTERLVFNYRLPRPGIVVISIYFLSKAAP